MLKRLLKLLAIAVPIGIFVGCISVYAFNNLSMSSSAVGSPNSAPSLDLVTSVGGITSNAVSLGATTATSLAITGTPTSTFGGVVSSTAFFQDIGGVATNTFGGGVVSTTRIVLGVGASTMPSIIMGGDTDTGFYNDADGSWTFMTNGNTGIGFGSTAIAVAKNIQPTSGAGEGGISVGVISRRVGNIFTSLSIYATGTTANPNQGGITTTNSTTTNSTTTGAFAFTGTSVAKFSGAVSSTAFSSDLNGTTSTFQGVSTTKLALSNAPTLASGGNTLCVSASGFVSQENATCAVSSAFFKQHVISLSLTDMLEEVKKLRAIQYDMIETGKHEEGFLAEEVARIDPTLVVYDPPVSPEHLAFDKKNYPDTIITKDGKPFLAKTVDYGRVSVILAGGLQAEDTARLEYQKQNDAKVAALERRVNWLEYIWKILEGWIKKDNN